MNKELEFRTAENIERIANCLEQIVQQTAPIVSAGVKPEALKDRWIKKAVAAFVEFIDYLGEFNKFPFDEIDKQAWIKNFTISMETREETKPALKMQVDKMSDVIDEELKNSKGKLVYVPEQKPIWTNDPRYKCEQDIILRYSGILREIIYQFSMLSLDQDVRFSSPVGYVTFHFKESGE